MTKQEIFEMVCETVCNWNRVQSRVAYGEFQVFIRGEWEVVRNYGELGELLGTDIDTDYMFDVVFGGNL